MSPARLDLHRSDEWRSRDVGRTVFRSKSVMRRLWAALIDRLRKSGGPERRSTLRREEKIPRAGLHRILICSTSQDGEDLPRLRQLLSELEESCPGSQVDVVACEHRARSLCRDHANFGNFHLVPKRPLRHPWRLLKVVVRIRRERYDLAIDPTLDSKSSRYLVKHCWSTYRIGIDCGRARYELDLAMPKTGEMGRSSRIPIDLVRWALAEDRSARRPIQAP